MLKVTRLIAGEYVRIQSTGKLAEFKCNSTNPYCDYTTGTCSSPVSYTHLIFRLMKVTDSVRPKMFQLLITLFWKTSSNLLFSYFSFPFLFFFQYLFSSSCFFFVSFNRQTYSLQILYLFRFTQTSSTFSEQFV